MWMRNGQQYFCTSNHSRGCVRVSGRPQPDWFRDSLDELKSLLTLNYGIQLILGG